MQAAQQEFGSFVAGESAIQASRAQAMGLSRLAAMRESQRLEALDHYDVMDTPPEEAFDSITRLTRQLLGVPMATVSFIDGHREWFKSRDGVSEPQIARATALGEGVITQERAIAILDAVEDGDFADNPSVAGSPYIGFYAGTPLRTEAGQIIGVLAAMDTAPRDFGATEARLLADLGSMAMTVLDLRLRMTVDPVTGVMSRGALRAEFERAFLLARRHRHEMSCLAVGIDHLQAIVARHGVAQGDDMLRRCAEIVQDQLRASDVVGRLDGSTFGVLLPFTGKEGAREVAERLRTRLGDLEIALESNPIKVAASFGLASFEAGMRSASLLLEEAEAGLFHARQHGGNRVVAWPRKAAPGSQMRRRVFKAGRIDGSHDGAGTACTLRSLSGHHATLDVNDCDAVPERFVLHVPADGLRLTCRVSNRDVRQVEVEIA